MKTQLSILTLTVLLLLTFENCTHKNNKQPTQEKVETDIASVELESSDSAFPLPTIPVMMTDPKERTLYLSQHYWDLFPFIDTALISQPDITEQGFVDYIQLLYEIPHTRAQSSLHSMMNKAKASKEMYVHFAELYEKYFYDPNSPFRNDEFYLPVVENILQSGVLSETEQLRYVFQQEMLLKNRVGNKATDFTYTLANGEKKRMHNLKSNYLLLFFTNPDCPACAEITHHISNSKVLADIFSLNSPSTNMLTVLSIYPDSNIDEWRKALPHLPQQHWVNAYDNGTLITNKRLYDIKAIPTLYLIDKNKQVIIKDGTLDEIEAYFMKVR